MKLNLSKFKKVSQDKDFTTLRHADGHEMKLAHGGLAKHNRMELEKLPMYGDANNPKLQQSKLAEGGHPTDPTQRHLLPGDKIPNEIQKEVVNKARQSYAEGGEASDEEIIHKKQAIDEYNKTHEDEPQDYPQDVTARMQKAKDYTPPQKLADGGPAKKKPSLTGPPDEETPPQPAPSATPESGIGKVVHEKNDPEKLRQIHAFAQGGMPGDRPVHALKKSHIGSITHKMFAEGGENIDYKALGVPGDVPQSKAADMPQGDVPYGTAGMPAQAPQQAQPAPPMPDTSAPIPVSPSPQMEPIDAQQPQAQAPRQSQPLSPEDQARAQMQNPNPIHGAGEQAAAQIGMAKAEGDLGAAQANVEAGRQKQIANTLIDFNRQVETNKKERDAFIQDINNGHIDINRYMGSMDTGQKMGTAIALALGGLGSSVSGGSNTALDFLNKQIDRDIEAQRTDLGKKENLLSANLKAYGNIRDAYDATRQNLNDIATSKINQLADKAQSPLAKFRAQALNGERERLLAPEVLQFNMRQMAGQKIASGQGVDAMDLANAGLMSPEQAIKEQSSLNKQPSHINQINSVFDQLDKEQTFGNRIMNPLQSASRIDALNAQLTNIVMDADVSKRLTPESAKREVEPFYFKVTDSHATREMNRQGVLALAKQKAAGETPTVTKYSPQTNPNYSTLEQRILAAARANPNHPNSAAIIRKLGGQ